MKNFGGVPTVTSHRGRTVHAQPASRSAMAHIVQTVYWFRCRVSIPTAPRKQTRQKRRQGWESVPARMGIIRTCTLIPDTPCSNSGHLLIEHNSRTANANTKRMIQNGNQYTQSCRVLQNRKSNQIKCVFSTCMCQTHNKMSDGRNLTRSWALSAQWTTLGATRHTPGSPRAAPRTHE